MYVIVMMSVVVCLSHAQERAMLPVAAFDHLLRLRWHGVGCTNTRACRQAGGRVDGAGSRLHAGYRVLACRKPAAGASVSGGTGSSGWLPFPIFSPPQVTL
jgi:uncharacterized membrane protein